MKKSAISRAVLLFLGILFGTVLAPLTYTNGIMTLSVVSAAPTCADKGATGPGLNQGGVDPRLSPITNLSLLRTPPPPGTSYACAYFGGGGYRYYNENDKLLGATTGLPGQTGYTYDANLQGAKTPVKCASLSDYASNPGECLVRAAFAGLGSFFMWAGIKIATFAGMVFEAALKYLIVDFATYLNKFLKPAIDTGWTALRDIANIIIIGLFVFIAINIILGVKEFGEKRKIAQVLIVAVLINFSLLFTKIIVDASNFTAYQFYNSMGGEKIFSGTQSFGQTISIPNQENTATLSASGVSAKFMDFLGVEGIADSYSILREAQEKTQYATAALAYGFLALLFLLFVAFVFLYGAFLIASRAILIVFLMLTSALAFASWLIPQEFIEKGFKRWWESLLKTAFFAPILMALLWMTINVSETLSSALKNATGRRGSLGALAAQASDVANITAVLSFFMVLGLLYATFATANAFSKSISGFRFATAGLGGLLKYGGLAVPGLAWRFGLAPLARQTLGRAAYFTRDQIIGEGKDMRIKAGELRELSNLQFGRGKITEKDWRQRQQEAAMLETKAAKRATWAGRVNTIAGAGFNIADTETAKSLVKMLGVSPLAAGQRPKDVPEGFKQAIEGKIKVGEERARALEVSASERQKIRDQEREKAYKDRAAGAEQRERAHSVAQQEHDAHEAESRREGGEVSNARKELTRMQEEAERAKRGIEAATKAHIDGLKTRLQSMADSPDDHPERLRILREIDEKETEGANKKKVGSAAVKAAEDRLTEALKPLKAAGEKLEKAAEDLNDYNRETDQKGKDEGAKKIRYGQVGATETSRILGKKSAGVFYKITGDSEHVGDEVRSKMRARMGTGNLRAAISQLRDEAPRTLESEEEAEGV